MQTMNLSLAANLSAGLFLYMFPNGCRDWDETTAAGQRTFDGTHIFLGAGIVTGIRVSNPPAQSDQMLLAVFDAIDETLQLPIAGGTPAPLNPIRYRINCVAAPAGTKGQAAAAANLSPGVLFDPVLVNTNGTAAVPNLANARKLAEFQIVTSATDSNGPITMTGPLSIPIDNLVCPHGMIIRVQNLSGSAIAYTASLPLKIDVDYVPTTTGSTRRKWAPRNAATHATKLGRSLSHLPLSV